MMSYSIIPRQSTMIVPSSTQQSRWVRRSDHHNRSFSRVTNGVIVPLNTPFKNFGFQQTSQFLHGTHMPRYRCAHTRLHILLTIPIMFQVVVKIISLSLLATQYRHGAVFTVSPHHTLSIRTIFQNATNYTVHRKHLFLSRKIPLWKEVTVSFPSKSQHISPSIRIPADNDRKSPWNVQVSSVDDR